MFATFSGYRERVTSGRVRRRSSRPPFPRPGLVRPTPSPRLPQPTPPRRSGESCAQQSPRSRFAQPVAAASGSCRWTTAAVRHGRATGSAVERVAAMRRHTGTHSGPHSCDILAHFLDVATKNLPAPMDASGRNDARSARRARRRGAVRHADCRGRSGPTRPGLPRHDSCRIFPTSRAHVRPRVHRGRPHERAAQEGRSPISCALNTRCEWPHTLSHDCPANRGRNCLPMRSIVIYGCLKGAGTGAA